MSAQAHYRAVFDRLDSDEVFRGNVVDIADPDYNPSVRKAPYLVLESDQGDPEYGALTSPTPTAYEFEFTLVYVGEDGNQCRAWCDHARKLLLTGWRPEIAGYRVDRIRLEASTKAAPDTSFSPTLIYGADSMTMTTRPRKPAPEAQREDEQ